MKMRILIKGSRYDQYRRELMFDPLIELSQLCWAVFASMTAVGRWFLISPLIMIETANRAIHGKKKKESGWYE
jgi:hypothetical protein